MLSGIAKKAGGDKRGERPNQRAGVAAISTSCRIDGTVVVHTVRTRAGSRHKGNYKEGTSVGSGILSSGLRR